MLPFDMTASRWWQRRKWEDERWKQKQKSPAWQFNRSIEKESEHVYGKYYQAFDKVLYEFDYLKVQEDELSYGRSMLLRFVYVLPDDRGEGVLRRFLDLAKRQANKHRCLLVAYCSPFEIDKERLAEIDNRKDKLKWIAEDLEDYAVWFRGYPWETGWKKRRKLMKQNFLNAGWEPINLRDLLKDQGMGKDRINKSVNWYFSYVPPTLDQEFYEKMKWRLRNRKVKKAI